MTDTFRDRLKVKCSECGKQLKVPARLGGKTGKCPNCGERIEIPFSPHGILEYDNASSELSDDDFVDESIPAFGANNHGRMSDKDQPEKREWAGFGIEKKGWDAGILGGLAMMAIAVIWFVVGLMAGWIFYYPPILFVIGLIGFIRGLFQGNVKGQQQHRPPGFDEEF